jgi:hypothetical protein
VSVVELSDEENVAILAETFTENLSDIGDKTRQIAVLNRLYKLLDSSTPQHYIYETVEGCDELEVIRVGGDQRIFCRLVMGIPHGDKHYNVLFVFYVDPHRYRPDQLAAFDEAAEQRLDEITSFDAVDAVDEYLEEMDAFTAGEIKRQNQPIGRVKGSHELCSEVVKTTGHHLLIIPQPKFGL